MRLKSRGLGRKELVMDFREYQVIREGEEIVIVGAIRDPVNWDFSIRMCEDDLAGITHLAVQKPMLGIILRSLFKRIRGRHWTQEHSEHIAEGKKRLVAAKEKAAQRIKANREAAREGSTPPAAGETIR